MLSQEAIYFQAALIVLFVVYLKFRKSKLFSFMKPVEALLGRTSTELNQRPKSDKLDSQAAFMQPEVLRFIGTSLSESGLLVSGDDADVAHEAMDAFREDFAIFRKMLLLTPTATNFQEHLATLIVKAERLQKQLQKNIVRSPYYEQWLVAFLQIYSE
jgi:hypothetical protein